jgi:hypothetical protein
MLKSQAFWIGVLVGLILMYVYSNHLKGKGGMGGGS